MSKFFTKVSNCTKAKNNLELAIQEFLKENDRICIEAKDLKIFMENIISQIGFLNQEHKRCAPKVASWIKCGMSEKKDFALHGTECISFHLFEIKQDYALQT